MKLTIIASLLMLNACAGYSASPELYFTSKHTRDKTPAGKEYNERNFGGGLHVVQDKSRGWRYGGRAAAYNNSINRQSAYGAGTAEYCFDVDFNLCAGGMAGVVTGYGSPKPLLAPTLEAGFGRTSIVLTAFPTSDFNAGVIAGWVKFKAFEW